MTHLLTFAMTILTITGLVTGEKPSLKATIEQDVKVCNRVHRPQTALMACTSLIKSNKISSKLKSLAYTRRGQIFARSKQFKKSLYDLSQAIRLKATHAEAWFHRGTVYSLLKNHDRAVLNYTKVITLNPDYVMAYYNRGTALTRQKNYLRAIADFSKAIALKPSLWRAYVNRGILYIKTGKEDKALLDYNKAFALNPRVHAILVNRAALHMKAGRKKQAFQDYRAALKLKDGHGHVFSLQKKLKKLGFYQGAITGISDEKTRRALKKWILGNEVTH